MARVSAIVPNYNHSAYLKKRLDSIFLQQYRDFEVIILDDCSKDNSRQMIETYRHFPNTRIVLNQENSGSAFAQWKKGIDLAQGEFIWIAESDDFAAPEFLERLVAKMDVYPAVGLAYCQSWLIDLSDQIICNSTCWTDDLDPQRWQQDFVNNGIDEIKNFLLQKNCIPNASAVLFRKSLIKDIGYPDPSFKLCGDWLYWMKVLAISDIAFVAQPLNYWRQNSSNSRADSPGTLEWLEGEKVLRYGLQVTGAAEATQTKVLFDFLLRCWHWQYDYIRNLKTPEKST
jgi:glycosyltransferase involved in cell wall biosynthesis